MSELILERIRAHAAKLGLTHLAESAELLLTRAETEQMGYSQLLDLVLEEEVGLREGRRFRNALNLSGGRRVQLGAAALRARPDLPDELRTEPRPPRR